MKKNAGFSLVELLIALAASGIIILGISYLMAASQRNYNFGKKRIDLQQEAQISNLQLTNMLLEATDAHVSGPGLVVERTVVSGRGITSTEMNELLVRDGKIYLAVYPSGSAVGVDFHPMTDYVKSCSFQAIDIARSRKKVMKFSIDLESNGARYHTENTVTLRNSTK